MRTTLTLEDDIALQLERLRSETGKSLKEVVNELLRAGLRNQEKPRSPRTFRTQPRRLGPCLVGSIDDISEVLAIGEGEDHR